MYLTLTHKKSHWGVRLANAKVVTNVVTYRYFRCSRKAKTL